MVNNKLGIPGIACRVVTAPGKQAEWMELEKKDS